MINPQLLLVVGYLLLDHFSVVLASPRLALLALGLLVGLLLVRALRARRAWAWLLWAACLLLLLTPPAQRWAPLVLMLPATLINAGLAWLFGHTLLRGREPLVARMVRLLHASDAIQDPAVWGYARKVTAWWTALFCFNAAGTLGLALLATPGGLLLQLGFVPAWPLPAAWWSYFANAGCYLLVGLLFLGEFQLRKRLFPWQPYGNLFEFLRRALAIGPALAAEMAAERQATRAAAPQRAQPRP
jgi:uncharacterized membrane protein